MKNALAVLAYTTIPATIDDAAYWLTRLIAHFPRRDTAKDAVVIADLSADLVNAGVSLIALVATCDNIRTAATAKHPFFPPSGEILLQATDKTRWYLDTRKNLEAPRLIAQAARQRVPKPPSWAGKTWGVMDPEERQAFAFVVRQIGDDLGQRLCHDAQADRETILNQGESHAD